MRHGFKAQAERTSGDARQQLGLTPLDRLNPQVYAQHLGVMVLSFSDLELTAEIERQLLHTDSESWSGMTIKQNGTTAVLINPSHAAERQASTMMHELAHIILKHVAVGVEVSTGGILLISEYSEDDEAEADWLAATLLLPREALKHHRAQGRSNAQIAKLFGVSTALCDWRVRMTGVEVQMRRARAGAQ